jgi:hypothetical protein
LESPPGLLIFHFIELPNFLTNLPIFPCLTHVFLSCWLLINESMPKM